jgi:hypothetical protein
MNQYNRMIAAFEINSAWYACVQGAHATTERSRILHPFHEAFLSCMIGRAINFYLCLSCQSINPSNRVSRDQYNIVLK